MNDSITPHQPLTEQSTISDLIVALREMGSQVHNQRDTNAYNHAADSLAMHYADHAGTVNCMRFLERDNQELYKIIGIRHTLARNLIQKTLRAAKGPTAITNETTIENLSNALMEAARSAKEGYQARAYSTLGNALFFDVCGKGYIKGFRGKKNIKTIGDIVEGGEDAKLALGAVQGIERFGIDTLFDFLKEHGIVPQNQIS